MHLERERIAVLGALGTDERRVEQTPRQERSNAHSNVIVQSNQDIAFDLDVDVDSKVTVETSVLSIEPVRDIVSDSLETNYLQRYIPSG